jgi:hypothetical protein
MRFHLLLFATLGAVAMIPARETDRRWLAGDPHVHSRWSLDFDESTNPPTPIYDDAIYPIVRNAQMARDFGLHWMVSTDHGGPNHARLTRDSAYPDLEESRRLVPEVLQFLGLEMNMPGMDHHTLILPAGDDELSMLFEIERRFDAYEVWPRDPARQTEAARLAALAYMQQLARPPLVFANHPARSAGGLGKWNLDEPDELRQNMDAAPDVYRGMEAAPGHQAKTLESDGTPRRKSSRGSYGRKGGQTMGGFDQMTAVLGGVWDALLGEGRRFWITLGSDSHIHYRETSHEGQDFWPGEFHKTYVLAVPNHDDILDGLRHGRVFVAAGDLITRLDVTASAAGGEAQMGGTLRTEPGSDVKLTIRFRVPPRAKDGQKLTRVDLIAGDVYGPAGPRKDRNDSTRVVSRFAPAAWSAQGEDYLIETTLPASRNMYIRVRGTSSTELEPSMDPIGEVPFADLWFYSNPVFIEVVAPSR